LLRCVTTPVGRAPPPLCCPSQHSPPVLFPFRAQPAPREHRDFVSTNARAAFAAATGRPAVRDPADPAPKHEEYGQVPAYLRERKETRLALEERARLAAKEREGCPPGHRLMPEAERLETLALLEGSLREAKDALSKMRLTSDVPSTLKRRDELDAKCRKMEDAIVVFTRPKVFVKE
jgi:hypothetical protein